MIVFLSFGLMYKTHSVSSFLLHLIRLILIQHVLTTTLQFQPNDYFLNLLESSFTTELLLGDLNQIAAYVSLCPTSTLNPGTPCGLSPLSSPVYILLW